jgi:hypothetical protein
VAGRWFSSGTLVSSTSKTDCHDITEILLKVALTTKPLAPISIKQRVGFGMVMVFNAIFNNILDTLYIVAGSFIGGFKANYYLYFQ